MNRFLSIIAVSFALVLSSCNDWLDVDLDNKVDDNKLFGSAEGFQEALAGVYSEMSKANMYGQALSMEFPDLLAQYYSYNSVSNTYVYWKDFDYTNSGVASTQSGMWTRLYHNIGQVNCILEWADKNASVMTEAQHDQVRGEALALRAYMHFDLYRLFSPDVKISPKADGIPYNKRFGVSLPAMYSAEETVQLVINDLLEAEKCLADDPITSVVPYEITSDDDLGSAKDAADKYVARMNLYAVKAMLARAYQARGDYRKAIEKAREVIDSGKFRLLDFGSIDKGEASVDILFSDEHIFSLRNRDMRTISQNLHYNKVSSGVTSFAPLPFNSISSVYESNNDDVRYAKWFDLGNFVKFIPDSTNVFTQKMPMIKLSEMYLLAAECSYASSPSDALDYVNTLRDHRIRNNRHWNSVTLDYIIQEMRREYVGEGQLWYVYKRNNLTIPGSGSMEGDVQPSDDIFVFPMPDSEISTGHRDQRD